MRGSVRKRGATWTWYLFAPDPVTTLGLLYEAAAA